MTVSGSIEEIIFRNDDNGYTVLVIECDGEPLTCVGTFSPVSEGEFLSLEGEFCLHPKFGKQFKVSRVSVSRPDTLEGIVRYLGSGLIKGIGPKTAANIVGRFGTKTFDIIKFNPSRLSEIKGITAVKAKEIAANCAKIENMQNVMTFLQAHDIPLGTSLKIYREYGDDTIDCLSQNPYRLVEDIDGIGFITADKIAAKLGVEKNSEYRLRAGILYTLKEAADKSGNTFLPQDTLIEQAASLLGADTESVEDAVRSLIVSRAIKTVKTDDCDGFMLHSLFRAEKSAAKKLAEFITAGDTVIRDCKEEITEFERGEGIKLHPVQKKAIETATQGSVAVITGGPGTGKTTIVKCILSIFDRRGIKTILMAPTGRAAKRMSESCGREAYTVHRALNIGRDGESSGEPISAGAVIVDEFSMVDVYLLGALLKRMPNGAKLIFVGDSDQLPSVGAGNVLKDIITSDCVPVVRLERIYRQSGESLIVENAHRVNGGVMPILNKTDGDFFFCAAHSPQEIADITVGLACERIPKFLGVEPYKVQVLCPLKSGISGSVNLNRVLQRKLTAGGGAFIETEECRYLIGDKVMHINNNYNLAWRRLTGGVIESGEGVFNGDMGIITDIRPGTGEIDVRFEDGREATYNQEVRSQLVPAYAITVHKSQGSEFDAVIIPLYGGNPVIMTRNLLYTAITRAKRAAVIVGESYVVKRMVLNDYVAMRYSMLKNFLTEAVEREAVLFGNNFKG